MRNMLAQVCVLALALAGCANNDFNGTQGFAGGQIPRPQTVMVSDLAFSSEVVTVDRSYVARLQRKAGKMTAEESRQRTAERVNDEIVAAMIATLREAGIEAQRGNGDKLTYGDNAVLINGKLHATDQSKSTKPTPVGFGPGRSGVAADVMLVQVGWAGKRQLVSLTAEPPSGRKPAPPGGAPRAAAPGSAAAERLSPDVEAQARRLGRAAGEKIVAFAQDQGWLNTPESGEAAAATPG